VCSLPQVGHVQGTVAAGLEEKMLVMLSKIPPEAGVAALAALAAPGVFVAPAALAAVGTVWAADMFLRGDIF